MKRVDLMQLLVATISAVGETPFNDARRIRRGERDHELGLNRPAWPNLAPAPPAWEPNDGYFRRLIERDEKGILAMPLEEAMLRFPAAPLHGVQRLHEGHNSAAGGEAQNFHTYRILTKQGFKGSVERIFLFHNGLNELHRMGLYYQLASHLLDSRQATACILRPFPGHLTRFPYYGFADTPLDRYLWDGSHLLRQFLRYMVETQWFLSALVKRSMYRCPSGANLLAAGEKGEPNRLQDERLAEVMGDAWRDLYRASSEELAKAKEEQTKAPGMEKIVLGSDRFREDIASLRSYLGLCEQPNLGSELTDDREPSLHVIGYSLGGFVAQSAFMSWPFVIDSCSTLLSGGALRELAPTAFADPEEWQTVLHSLRYELDEAMISGRLGSRPGQLAGMERDLYLYLQRTFYEVFQQEYRGSFQSRLTEFRQRMLFVVGGNDPIVRPRSVLDSEPPGGINLLEIGGLGHFIGNRPESLEETKQRKYWLPEMGGLVSRFAEEVTRAHRETREDTWLAPDLTIPPPRSGAGGGDKEEILLTDVERDAFNQDGALPTKLFDRYLEDLLVRDTAGSHGYLWILRNEMPTFILDQFSIQQRACALHHDDVGVVEYCRGVESRRDALFANRPTISVVIPWNARRILNCIDAPHGFPSQAETAPGQMPTWLEPPRIWELCAETCTKLVADGNRRTVMVFDGRRLIAPQRRDEQAKMTAARKARAAIVHAGRELVSENAVEARPDGRLRVPSLPDCWIWASQKFLNLDRRTSAEEVAPRFLSAAADARLENSTLARSIREDDLRIITVSRARYNPRFRGRLVTDLESAKTLLLHAALCVSASVPFEMFDWDTAEAESNRLPLRFMLARADDARRTVERVV